MTDGWKKAFEYLIPIQNEEQVEKHNEMCREMFGDKFNHLKSTDEHIDILLDKLVEAIEKIGDDGGWYIGDGIRVKVEIEYEPEDK